jgi:hypothetical protein
VSKPACRSECSLECAICSFPATIAAPSKGSCGRNCNRALVWSSSLQYTRQARSHVAMATSLQRCRGCSAARSQAGAGLRVRTARVAASGSSAAGVQAGARIAVVDSGSYTVKGSVRKVNEDRFDIKVRLGVAVSSHAHVTGVIEMRARELGRALSLSMCFYEVVLAFYTTNACLIRRPICPAPWSHPPLWGVHTYSWLLPAQLAMSGAMPACMTGTVCKLCARAHVASALSLKATTSAGTAI